MSRLCLFVCAVLFLTCTPALAEVFFNFDGKILSIDRPSRPFRPPPPPVGVRRQAARPPASPSHSTPAVSPERAADRTAALQVPHLADAPPTPDQAPPAVVDGGPRPMIEPEAPEVVRLKAGQAVGSILIDTASRRLYFFVSRTEAYRYPISVGREGFRWTGTERVSYKRSWPDWHPPAEMRERDPRLPEVMTGGMKNPLGARAIYLSDTLYRIHGTNNVTTIGTAASSGCFRMRNEHVAHLWRLVRPGTKVTVVDYLPPEIEANTSK